MRDLSRTARLFLLAVSLEGFALGLAVLRQWPDTLDEHIPAAVALLLAAVVTEHFAIPMFRGGYLSVSTVPHIAAVLVLPAPLALVVGLVGIVSNQIVGRAPLYKLAFNAGCTALTMSLTALVADALLAGPSLPPSPGPYHLLVVAVVSVTYLASNNLLTGSMIALASRQSVRFIVVDQAKRTLLPECAIAVLGGLLAFVWVHSPGWSIVLVFPVGIAYLTIKFVYRMETETTEAVRTMATIVDERDHYTYFHSSNVARYAEVLAREMGLPPSEVELIASAAAVHDLGKIGISNKALRKSGPLSAEEWREMKTHPEIGARILSHFRSYRGGVKYVLHHHERWDGKGYPAGLRGEQIPLGARVIAVADAFDAMTTDRPYRRHLSREEAIQRLRDASGTQLDPVAVAHFLRVLEREDFGREPRPIPIPRPSLEPELDEQASRLAG